MALVLAAGASASLLFGSYVPTLRTVGFPPSQHALRGPYFGAVDLLHGDNPYRPGPQGDRASDAMARELGIERTLTLYSPPILLLYAPLTWLGFPAAKTVVLSLNLACAGLVAWLLLRLVHASPSALPLLILAVAAFGEIRRTLVLGQINLAILLALVLAMVCAERGRLIAAGILVGLAALAKPIPSVLLLGFALRRQWRAVTGALATVAGGALISVLAFGLEVNRDYLEATRVIATQANFRLGNQSLRALQLRAAEAPAPPDTRKAGPIWWLAAAGVIAATAAVVALRPAPIPLSLSLLLAAGMLASPRDLSNYSVWLLPGLVLAFWETAQAGRWPLVLLAGAAYHLASIPASLSRTQSLLPGFHLAWVFASSQVLGLVLLWLLLTSLHLRRPDPPVA